MFVTGVSEYLRFDDGSLDVDWLISTGGTRFKHPDARV